MACTFVSPHRQGGAHASQRPPAAVGMTVLFYLLKCETSKRSFLLSSNEYFYIAQKCLIALECIQKFRWEVSPKQDSHCIGDQANKPGAQRTIQARGNSTNQVNSRCHCFCHSSSTDARAVHWLRVFVVTNF